MHIDVKFLKQWGAYNTGELARFARNEAEQLIAKGFALEQAVVAAAEKAVGGKAPGKKGGAAKSSTDKASADAASTDASTGTDASTDPITGTNPASADGTPSEGNGAVSDAAPNAPGADAQPLI